jgi:hypothetical protein
VIGVIGPLPARRRDPRPSPERPRPLRVHVPTEQQRRGAASGFRGPGY